MEHERAGKLLEIDNSSISFNSELADTNIPTEVLNEIKQSNLLIIPYKQFRDKKGNFSQKLRWNLLIIYVKILQKV